MVRASPHHSTTSEGTFRVDIHLTAVVEPVISEVISTWGVPGLLAAAAMAIAIGGAVWFVKASSGLTAERETTIDRQMRRIDSLVAQLSEATKDKNTYLESYLAVKYPGSKHRDIAEQVGMDPVAEEDA